MLGKRFALAIASVAFAAFIATPLPSIVSAQDMRNFDIVNQTSARIDAVYVSPTTSSTWGSNILTEQVPPGQTLQVRFDPSVNTGVCVYDLYVSYTDGDSDPVTGLNICQILRVVVTDTQITWE